MRSLEAAETTVEANPETVTPRLAAMLRDAGVTRVSLGAQSFRPHLLATLERAATPDDVRRAFGLLRDAGFDNLSLDLIYGIPGQSPDDLAADLDEAIALGPEHLSCYELEAKPGTRFTHAHGDELARQADAMEGYFEQVVARLTGAGFRWYETANFCRDEARDLRAHHNLGYWLGRDYLGLGIGAVSTVDGTRRRNTPRLHAYVDALAAGAAPPRELEALPRRGADDGARHARPPARRAARARRGRAGARPGRAPAPRSASASPSGPGGHARPDRSGAGSSAAASRPSCSRSCPDVASRDPSERKGGRLPERNRESSAPCQTEPSGEWPPRPHTESRATASPTPAGDPAAVVEEYVATGQPVGSKHLVE